VFSVQNKRENTFLETKPNFPLTGKCFPLTNFPNGKQTQESLESGFPETTFRETNGPIVVSNSRSLALEKHHSSNKYKCIFLDLFIFCIWYNMVDVKYYDTKTKSLVHLQFSDSNSATVEVCRLWSHGWNTGSEGSFSRWIYSLNSYHMGKQIHIFNLHGYICGRVYIQVYILTSVSYNFVSVTIYYLVWPCSFWQIIASLELYNSFPALTVQINEFVKLGGDQLVPYYADILGAILPCISDKEEKIRVVSWFKLSERRKTCAMHTMLRCLLVLRLLVKPMKSFVQSGLILLQDLMLEQFSSLQRGIAL